MPDTSDAAAQSKAVRTSFLRLLIEDIIDARLTAGTRSTQVAKRHYVRSLFAAIEGMVWEYREHILEIARLTDAATFEEEIAFSEISYSVTPQGKIVKTARYLPLLAMFRLTTALAQRINPELEARFDELGWQTLQQAFDVRHRITHPKSLSDLELNDLDLRRCEVGFDWLFDRCLNAMGHANEALELEAESFATFLEQLKQGDPDAIAAYRAVASDKDATD